MKILSEISREFVCSNCETRSEYEDTDIQCKELPLAFDEFDPVKAYFISCPRCHIHIGLKFTKYQKAIADNSQNKTE